MLQTEITSHGLQEIFREMVSSVRELNRRIDELRLVIKSGWCDEKSTPKVLDRIARLMESKLCVIYSIHDIRMQLLSTYSVGSVERNKMEDILDISTLYKDLKSI